MEKKTFEHYLLYILLSKLCRLPYVKKGKKVISQYLTLCVIRELLEDFLNYTKKFINMYCLR